MWRSVATFALLLLAGRIRVASQGVVALHPKERNI